MPLSALLQWCLTPHESVAHAIQQEFPRDDRIHTHIACGVWPVCYLCHSCLLSFFCGCLDCALLSTCVLSKQTSRSKPCCWGSAIKAKPLPCRSRHETELVSYVVQERHYIPPSSADEAVEIWVCNLLNTMNTMIGIR